MHYRGVEALEHGVGLVAGGITFGFWSLLLLWGSTSTTNLKSQWRPIYYLVFGISLICVTTSTIGFFPPWHVPFWPSCDAFYCVIGFLLFLACQRNGARIRFYSQRGFPSLIMAGILLASIWPGALAGVIGGIFLGVAIGFHVVMLIPKARHLLMQ